MLVTFPFTDLSGQKVRPALVLSSQVGDDVILAFITSRVGNTSDANEEHVLETSDPEFPSTGLKVTSRIRLNKVVTLEQTLVRRRLGAIGPETRQAVDSALRFVFDL